MPVALLDGVRDAGVEFFHLPLEEKLRHANRDDAGEFQPEGYGIDRVDTDEQVLDWCDRLYLTVQPEEERRTQFWPARPPSLGRLLHEYALGQRARRAGGEARAHGHGAATGVRRGVLPRLSRREGRHAGTYARFTWSRQDPRERNCAYLYAQRTQFLEVLKD